ncbi:hypothetical protein GCM10010266_28340 [Streptomyces griseomycini]|nr:hypothetical protein GCM10010266_28340 [Streptomyces griseomycini]
MSGGTFVVADLDGNRTRRPTRRARRYEALRRSAERRAPAASPATAPGYGTAGSRLRPADLPLGICRRARVAGECLPGRAGP